MKQNLTLAIFLTIVFSTCAQAQLTRQDLLGTWTTTNKDSIYFRSDTVEFVQDINHWYGREICNIIDFEVTKQDLKFLQTYRCSEPGKVTEFKDKQTIMIRESEYFQILEIKLSGWTDLFEIISYTESRIDRYPYDIKSLKLKRLR